MSYALKAKIVMIMAPIILVAGFAVFTFSVAGSFLAPRTLPRTVGVTTDRPQYKVGQAINVLLFNDSDRSAYVVNECPDAPLTVSRFAAGVWIQLHAMAARSKCDGEPRQYEIRSGDIVQVNYDYWMSLFMQPGTYRVTASFIPYSGEASAEFTIVP